MREEDVAAAEAVSFTLYCLTDTNDVVLCRLTHDNLYQTALACAAAKANPGRDCENARDWDLKTRTLAGPQLKALTMTMKLTP